MRRAPPNDTDPRSEALLIEGFRAMSSSQKLMLAGALSSAVRELALSDVRARYPGDSEREHLMRAASRWTPPAVMKRGFDWDVEQHGF